MSTSTVAPPGARRHLRRLGAVATTGVVALALALGGVTSASAAQGGSWGTFTATGSARAYTGTMTLPGGFPATTFTSTSRQATIPSGSSTWQAASTPPGAQHGSSRGLPYLNLRPAQDSPTAAAASVTTYSFATPTPASGWSFVLGDVDADQVTVTATGADGAAVPASALGFRGTYNYCQGAGTPSCDSAGVGDQPTWDAATSTLVGNAAAADTEGAAAWFSPTTPLSSLTFTFQQRSGFPVYQTWFATTTFGLTGTATVGGAPFPGALVTVRDASGTVVATTTTGADGGYAVPALTAAPGYVATIEAPEGTDAAVPVTVDLSSADGVADFAFPDDVAPATVSVEGTILDTEGTPVAGVPLQLVSEADGTLEGETTTADDGTFAFPGLDADTRVVLERTDTDEELSRFTPNGGGTIPQDLITPVPAPAATVDVTGTITEPDGTPAADATLDVVAVDPADPEALPTGETVTVVTDETGAFEVPGLLPETDYVIVVDEKAEAPVPFTTPAVGEPSVPLELAVPAAESVSVGGTLVDAEGDPLAETPVAVLPLDGDTAVGTDTTDADGSFVVDGLEPDTDYLLVVDGDTDTAIAFRTGGTDTSLGTVVVDLPMDPGVPSPSPSDPGVPSPSPSDPGVPAPLPGDPGAPVAPAPAPAAPAPGLAFTGSDAALPLGLGAGLLLLGVGALVARGVVRRRHRLEEPAGPGD